MMQEIKTNTWKDNPMFTDRKNIFKMFILQIYRFSTFLIKIITFSIEIEKSPKIPMKKQKIPNSPAILSEEEKS